MNGARFTASVFHTLGVSPILGRAFTQKEEDGHEPVAVISYGLWLSRYHRDPHIIGNSIILDRKAYSIIGVMPRNFDFPPTAGYLDRAQLWVPLSLTADELSDEHAGFWGYQMIARLKDGVILSQAHGMPTALLSRLCEISLLLSQGFTSAVMSLLCLNTKLRRFGHC